MTPLLWAKPYFDSLRLKMRLEVLGHGDKSKGPLLTSPSLTQRHAKQCIETSTRFLLLCHGWYFECPSNPVPLLGAAHLDKRGDTLS